MIKIESPFYLSKSRHRCLRPSFSPAESQAKEVFLQGTLLSIETDGKIYDLSTDDAPSDDGFRSRGLCWSRRIVPLGQGISLEQQLLRANEGNAVALSWRLLGQALVPARLTAAPIFSLGGSTSTEPFAFEPETEGGRLTWRPFQGAARIIADTNGRCSPRPTLDNRHREPDIALPAVFDFNLGRRPSILILSAESNHGSCADPIIGGFLAQLTPPQPQSGHREYLQGLAAA